MRKLVFRALVVVVVAAGLALVAFGPARLRPWRCHNASEHSSARAAAHAYYASCWDPPDHIDGGRPARLYGNEWNKATEYVARWDGEKNPKIRFLIVGRKTPHSGWIALSEGTGP